LLDSDHFGPHCAFARVYIHTDSGVLLCSIRLPALDLDLSYSPWVDDVPTGMAGSTSFGQPAALSAAALGVPPPTARLLPGIEAAAQGGADGVRARPPAPSWAAAGAGDGPRFPSS